MKLNKKAQVTIFIIIAVVLIGAVIGFFAFRGSFTQDRIPASFEPLYNTFLTCLEEDTLVGIDVLESKGGYIELPDFEPGSTYMPFSNQLDFLGNPIPYWYYVSGNNIQEEQVPSKGEMEEQLEGFIEEQITGCLFEEYYDNGFEVSWEDPKADVSIKDREVEVSLDMGFAISKGDENVVVNNHKKVVKSNLGNLYDSAVKIYNYEQDNLFLEDYGVDILRLYAPVDGVELTCSPLTWTANDIFDELENAIEANTLALKTKGGAYSLTKEENKYFIVDVSVDEDVRFINSKDWPHSFEIEPTDEDVLIAKPIGNQPGMGILGFCYVPYHYVYNVRYPTLVQIYSGDEIFQFPMAVVIQGNLPREALEGSEVKIGIPEFCEYKNTIVGVDTYDTKLNAIEADISYDCSGTKCDIGNTKFEESFSEVFPQCANGFIVATAEGFEDTKYLYSTTQSGSVDIIMDRLYDKNIQLMLSGNNYNGEAIISFISDDVSKTVVYPEQMSVELSEGQYEIQVQIFKNSSLKLDATSREQCVEVPQSGLGGLFGLMKEKCFDVEIPSQIISNVLAGGGIENYYILESELESLGVLEIGVESLPTPKTIGELQTNHLLFEEKGLEINFT